jgi:hypothetical protein
MMDLSTILCEPPAGFPAVGSIPLRLQEVDRRTARRYPAVTVEAWLSWEVDKTTDEIATSPALMLDFSEAGALLAVDRLPPAGVRIWLGLERPARERGIEVSPVAATLTRIGPHLLRLKFTRHCPSRMYTSVVLGIPATADSDLDREYDRA